MFICKYCKKNNFNNNCKCNTNTDNLNSDIWGPSAWHTIHSIVFAYPDNPTSIDKQNMLDFFNILTKILPCRECKIHLTENLAKLPPKLDSRTDLFNWSVDLHNIVNSYMGKPIYSVKDIVGKYSNLYSK